MPQRRPGGGHLHQRTSSKVTLTLTPSTPPNATRTMGQQSSQPTYRLLPPESPASSSRTLPPPLFRTPPAGQPDWSTAGGRERGALWTRRRLVLAVCAAVALILVLGGHNRSRYLARWGPDGEQETYGRAQAFKDDDAAGVPVGMDEFGRPGKGAPQEWHPAPERAPGSGPAKEQGAGDRLVKVGRPPAPAKVAAPVPVSDDEEAEDLPAPAVDFETTSVMDPEAAQKFIMVGWMGEQETKAQSHLYQLGLLAVALNRTLVLPGVKRSRFGSCYQNPFSLYYAADTFSSFGIPYITSDEFWSWTERQRSPPTAQVLTLVRGDPVPVEHITMPPERMCLGQRPLDFSQHQPTAHFIPTSDWKSDAARARFGEEVINGLLDPAASSTETVDGEETSSPSSRAPAVLVAHVNLRYPFLTPSLISRLSPYTFPTPSPYSYFPYSPHWTTLGHAITAHLSPFVGVHWRTETLEVDRLAPCGAALVSKLADVRAQHPEVKTLYLATDYPIEVLRDGGGRAEKATAHSGTMTKTLTPGHHAAMKDFLDALEGEGGAGLRLTSFLEEQKAVEWPTELAEAMKAVKGGIEDLDGAIVGIVDKIVLQSAELFYAGLPVPSAQGCAKLSQFTTQVISGRRDALRLADDRGADTTLWNEAGHFMLTKEAAARLAAEGDGGKKGRRNGGRSRR
ncbi:hypothetical protein JCM8097_000684 [Rhodosporidiobolus ruineniae]